MNGLTVVPQLGFTEALKEAWDKLTQCTGRSRRSEFWWTYLGYVIAGFVCSFIPFIGNIIKLALALAMIPIGIRRLHDTGRSGWWLGANILLGVAFIGIFISSLATAGILTAVTEPAASEDIIGLLVGVMLSLPVVLSGLVGFAYGIVVLVFLCQDSQPQANRYGPSPKYKTEDAASDSTDTTDRGQ